MMSCNNTEDSYDFDNPYASPKVDNCTLPDELAFPNEIDLNDDILFELIAEKIRKYNQLIFYAIAGILLFSAFVFYTYISFKISFLINYGIFGFYFGLLIVIGLKEQYIVNSLSRLLHYKRKFFTFDKPVISYAKEILKKRKAFKKTQVNQ